MSQAETITTSKEQLLAEVVRLAAAQVGADPASVTRETHFHNDLGYDSLDDVEFAMALEERFDLHVQDEVAESTRTVGQAFELVQAILAGRA